MRGGIESAGREPGEDKVPRICVPGAVATGNGRGRRLFHFPFLHERLLSDRRRQVPPALRDGRPVFSRAAFLKIAIPVCRSFNKAYLSGLPYFDISINIKIWKRVWPYLRSAPWLSQRVWRLFGFWCARDRKGFRPGFWQSAWRFNRRRCRSIWRSWSAAVCSFPSGAAVRSSMRRILPRCAGLSASCWRIVAMAARKSAAIFSENCRQMAGPASQHRQRELAGPGPWDRRDVHLLR